jgi:hypothetical protein
VCTTELGMTAKLQPEFAKKNALVIGLSVDTVEDHHGSFSLALTRTCTPHTHTSCLVVVDASSSG